MQVFDAGCGIWQSKEAPETVKKDFIDILKQLEGALGEKDYFLGDSFGFVDIELIGLATWFYAIEKCGGFEIKKECPKLSAWISRCMKRETVAKVVPEPEKIYEFVKMFRKMQGID